MGGIAATAMAKKARNPILKAPYTQNQPIVLNTEEYCGAIRGGVGATNRLSQYTYLYKEASTYEDPKPAQKPTCKPTFEKRKRLPPFHVAGNNPQNLPTEEENH